MTQTPGPPPDEPDPLSTPDLDEVRGSEEGDPAAETAAEPTSAYPAPTDDDPASFLNP